jgi:hypothetical protein
MKKTITVIALLAGAVSGYSQGSFYFYNSGSEGAPAVTMKSLIYNVSAATYTVQYGGGTVKEQIGQTSVDNPTGGVTYAGGGLGGSATTGTAYDAQMLAATGSGDALSTLAAVGTVLNFNTVTAGAGILKGNEVEQLPGTSPTATIAIAAWAVNSGGDLLAANTLAQAIADAIADAGEVNDGGYAWGISDTATIALAYGSNPPTPVPTTIESFSLGMAPPPVPEPSTIALGVIGASALLFRRRK